MVRTGATQVRDCILDPGSHRSWDSEPVFPAAALSDDTYADDLVRAAEKSGVDEAVLTGEGAVEGRRVAIITCEFGFLAGSIGVAAAERIVSAIERATAERLPILASPTSGGTRMQEGTLAFVQMIKISAAVSEHKSAGLPYLVYLRHPTTGGVFASWGSLGHVAVAEPGSLIGFLGPRVYEALYGRPFPEGVQTAENLAQHGMIDGIVEPSGLRSLTARALRVLCQDPSETPRSFSSTYSANREAYRPEHLAWDSITRSRRPDRPGAREFLSQCANDKVPLSGTGQGESSGALTLLFARFRGYSAVVLAQDRHAESSSAPLGPAALRAARRGIRIAGELDVPLVLIIDTQGAALSKEAEEGGLAGEIAGCIADLVTLTSPTVSVILGQGCGGGALALLPADRVLCAEHGWLAPLPPEGASAIVHRTPDRAPELAASQGVRSVDLLDAGIVDVIVPERPDAADEPADFCERLADYIADALIEVTRRPPERRYAERLRRYRDIGL